MSSAGRNAGGGIQVISRAGEILRALAGEHGGLSLAEVAQQVNLPRSTVHRIIRALEAEGLTASASPNGRYLLGPEVVRLANDQYGDLRSQVRPTMEQLSRLTDETVDLAVPAGARVVFIDQVVAPHPLRAVSAVGASFPVHCTAPGRALLAMLTDENIRQLLPPRLQKFTDSTVTSRADLVTEVEKVRTSGVATVRDEYTLGISAVGAVIRTASGILAAISIPVPSQRFAGREERLADALRNACDAISRRLVSG